MVSATPHFFFVDHRPAIFFNLHCSVMIIFAMKVRPLKVVPQFAQNKVQQISSALYTSSVIYYGHIITAMP